MAKKAKSTVKMPVENVKTLYIKTSPGPEPTNPVASKKDVDYDARERKWKAEDALRDIERAEGHKRDKALMKDVKNCAKEKIKSLSSIK